MHPRGPTSYLAGLVRSVASGRYGVEVVVEAAIIITLPRPARHRVPPVLQAAPAIGARRPVRQVEVVGLFGDGDVAP